MASPEPTPKQAHPYFVDLARRLVMLIDTKRKAKFCGKVAKRGQFSLRQLSFKSGVPYSTVKYVVTQGNIPNIETLDALLYGLGITVLDLLQTPELARRYSELSNTERYRTVVASGESPSTRSKRKSVPAVPENSLDTSSETI